MVLARGKIELVKNVSMPLIMLKTLTLQPIYVEYPIKIDAIIRHFNYFIKNIKLIFSFFKIIANIRLKLLL